MFQVIKYVEVMLIQKDINKRIFILVKFQTSSRFSSLDSIENLPFQSLSQFKSEQTRSSSYLPLSDEQNRLEESSRTKESLLYTHTSHSDFFYTSIYLLPIEIPFLSLLLLWDLDRLVSQPHAAPIVHRDGRDTTPQEIHRVAGPVRGRAGKERRKTKK